MRKYVYAVSMGLVSILATGSPLADDLPVYYLTKSGDKQTSYNVPSYWQDASGQSPAAIDANGRFVVRNGRGFKTSDFAGKSMTLGEVGGTYGWGYGRGNAAFANDGLFLAFGYAQNSLDNEGKSLSLKGEITVLSPKSKPFGFLCAKSTQTLNLSTASGDHFKSETADVGVYFGASVHGSSTSYSARYSNFVLGDCSQYLGEMTVVSKYALSETAPYYGTSLKIGGQMPGSLRVGVGGGLILTSSGLQVGTLALEAGSLIKTTVNCGSGTCYGISAAALEITGPVNVRADWKPVVSTTGEAVRCPFLTGPEGARLDEKKFVFVPDPEQDANSGGQRAHFEVDTKDDVDTLYLVVEPTVSLNAADPNSKWINVIGSAQTNAHVWSDGRVPHENAHYFVANRFRSTFDEGDWVFPGDSITLAGGAEFHLYGKKNLIVPEFNWWSGQIWSAETGDPTISGGIIRTYADGWQKAVSFDDKRLRFASEIVGDGTLVLSDMSSVGSTDDRRSGGFELQAMNTNFTGTIRVTRDQYAGKLLQSVQTLYVTDSRNLGGALEAFKFNALTLEQYSRLCAETDVTIEDDANRGIYIRTNGTMRVEAGKTMTVKRPVTVLGTLHKLGTGALELAGTVKFYDAASKTAVDAIRDEADVLDLHEGALRVGSARCCDGLTVRVEPGSEIVIPGGATGELAEFGLYNVKTATPFALGDGATSLPLRIDVGATPPDAGEHTVVLMTVANSALEAVKAMLPRKVVTFRGYRSSYSYEAVGADATKILCTYGPTGLILLLR